MIKGLRVAALAFVLFLAALSGSACKPDDINLSSPATPSSPVSLAITPAVVSMAPGSSLQLEAIGGFGNGITRKMTDQVTWSSLSPEAATVNSAGLVSSLPSSSGTVTITAVSGTLTASAAVSFSPLVSLSVSPVNPSIADGTSQQFKATGTLQNSASQDLTNSASWSSSDSSAAISGSGLATTAPGVTGTSTISATFSSVTGTSLLTTAQLKSIAVTPFNTSIARGTTQQFTATGTLSNNGTQSLGSFATWSSSSSSVAVVNNTGLAASVAPGSAVVTALFGTVSGSAVLTVSEPSLVSLSISPDSQTIASGTSLQFRAFAKFSDGGFRDVTDDVLWVSSNAQVAFADDAAGTNGRVTAVAAGTTQISASLFDVTSNRVILTVTAGTGAPVSSISITPANPSVPLGNTVQLTATSISSNGGIVENVTATAVWHSSNSTVAFVSQGFVTTLASGTTTITATFNGVSGSIVLMVNPL